MEKHDDSTAKKASPTNNTLSQEKLDALKTRESKAYVKLILKSQGSSTKRVPLLQQCLVAPLALSSLTPSSSN